MSRLKQTLHNVYTDDFKEYLTNNKRLTVTFSCSPKLSVSGESYEDAIKPDIAGDYTSVVGSRMYFKFVVADRTDIEDASRAVEAYGRAGVRVAPVYLMPMGGRSEEVQPQRTRGGEHLS